MSHLRNHHPKKHAISFRHALAGITEGFKGEPRFQLQLLIGFLALVLGVAFQISLTEWLVLILTIFFVLVTELINTAVENVVDLVTSDTHPLAKAAKDSAAGAVLVAAVGSVIVGVIIFLPHLT